MARAITVLAGLSALGIALFAVNDVAGRAGYAAVSWGNMDAVRARSDAELIELSREACREVVPNSYCINLPVTVADLPEDVVGVASASQLRFGSSPDDMIETITSESVSLSPILREAPEQYVRHVAAHEWNHIRQYILADTPTEYSELEAKANEYFAPRARRPLVKEEGLELLTDCQTVLGNKQLMGAGVYEVTPYVAEYLTATTMREACGDGWDRVLTAS